MSGHHLGCLEGWVSWDCGPEQVSVVSPCTPDFSPGEICILCGNVPRAVIQKSQVEVALPFLTKLQMSHGVTSAVFCWWKHSQAHPDLRGGDTDLTSQWKKYRRIWSYILKQPHGIMLWQYMCFLCCAQPCPTLCNPLDCSPPGSSVQKISQQEFWSGLLIPSLEDLPDPGIRPVSSAVTGRFFTTEPPGQPLLQSILLVKSCLVIFQPHVFVSFFCTAC